MTQYDFAKFQKDLEYLVNIDSNAENVAGIDKVADFLAKDFTSPMWHVGRLDVGEGIAKPLYITNTLEKDYDVAICCHMDTVFPDGTAAARPYSVKDNVAYGPGVCDMKASCLQAGYVLKALEANGTLKDLKIMLAYNPEEERGSAHTKGWLMELGAHSKYCLIMEAARPKGERVLERKGLIRYQVNLKGKAAHAGNNHDQGRSAVNEMAYWTLKLAALTDYSTGFTSNVGLVKGGIVYNSVAEDAFMDIDFRITNISQMEIIKKAFAELEEHAAKAEIATKVTQIAAQAPMASTPATAGLVEVIDNASKAYGMSTVWLKVGGGSDGNYTAAAGSTTVDGLGPIGGRFHTDAEYLELASIEPSLHVLEKILLDLQAKLHK